MVLIILDEKLLILGSFIPGALIPGTSQGYPSQIY